MIIVDLPGFEATKSDVGDRLIEISEKVLEKKTKTDIVLCVIGSDKINDQY